MTDKVQLIKEEIENQINFAEEDTRFSEPYREGLIAAYQTIKAFIDSLPEEHASEDLDFLVISLEETIGTSPHSREVIKEHLQKAAEWGRNHFEDKSEMVSGDLKEAAQRYCQEKNYMQPLDKEPSLETLTAIDAFIKGAEWKEKKDQETIELAEDHAMLAGMNRMKEEMMKDAVDAEVFVDYNINFGYGSLTANIDLDEQHLKEGDKVKIIIVKTEQQ